MKQDESHARAARLRAVAHDMLALANELENKYTVRKGAIFAYELASLQALGACASKEFVDRQRRHKSFDADVFGEPCWDMLLYLFVKSVEKQRARKSQVLIASGVPASTATRYFSVLQEMGYLESELSLTDNRVQFVTLTNDGMARMSSCLARQMRADQTGFESLNDMIEGNRQRTPSHVIADN
ncbi:hypothetical protein [Erythrobacter alti]|uniref:hypothetical protein n=1 Tax=Erythrobacter alti TaxID=1896145 RepID=UPI0030F3964B